MSKNFSHLNSLSSKNADIIKIIHHSVFAVSLDVGTYGSVSKLDSSEEINQHLHNIRSSRNARNRWFDKSITLIVEGNTRTGIMGEHSVCDALIPSIVGEYMVTDDIDKDSFPPLENIVAQTFGNRGTRVDGWERLDFDVDDRLRQAARVAESRAKALIKDSDYAVFYFESFGSEWIKHGATSTNLILQLQLTLSQYGYLPMLLYSWLSSLRGTSFVESLQPYMKLRSRGCSIMLAPKLYVRVRTIAVLGF